MEDFDTGKTLAGFFSSFGGILIKWVQWHPMAISGMRSAIGALTILVVFRNLRFTWTMPQIGGAIAYAGTVTLFVIATKLTTAAKHDFSAAVTFAAERLPVEKKQWTGAP